MSFDRIAPHYCWLETVAFGNQLQQARVAFVRALGAPRRVLVVGEGDGRFLARFVREYPGASVDCIEASPRMIALARQRVNGAPVSFIAEDLREVALPAGAYDLVVTHFFLDCFDDPELPVVIARLARAATPDAAWLIADFCYPPRGWRVWHARALIPTMYSFFRVVTGVEARRLVDYRPLLRAQGFKCTSEMISPNEMIGSELWQRR